MSYINDALRRAQSEKDGRYAHYGAILSAPLSERSRNRRRRIFFFSGAATVLIVAALFLYFWSATKPQSPPSKTDLPGTLSTAGSKKAGQTPGQAPGQSIDRPLQPKDQTAVQIPGQMAGQSPGRQVPADPVALYRTALDAQKGGRLDEAEAAYRKLLELRPGHAASLNNMGVIYLTRGRMQEAIGFFNLALAQKEVNADPYYNLACIYARMDNPARAIGYLRTAISMDSKIRESARTDQDLSTLRSNPEFKKLTE